MKWRRRVVIHPLEHDEKKINYYRLLKQQVYIQIFQFTMYCENRKIDALHDYTLQLTMIWDENELQKLGAMLLRDYKDGAFFWSGKYLMRNLQASDVSFVNEKFEERAGVEEFDRPSAKCIPFAIILHLAYRYRQLKLWNVLIQEKKYLDYIFGYDAHSSIHKDVEMTKTLKQ